MNENSNFVKMHMVRYIFYSRFNFVSNSGMKTFKRIPSVTRAEKTAQTISLFGKFENIKFTYPEASGEFVWFLFFRIK